MTENDDGLTIRKAVIGDVGRIHSLVNQLATEGAMLGLSRAEIYEQLRDFWVVQKGDVIVGVCALRIVWEDLAEIRSLAVDGCCRDLGIGRALVEICLEEARLLLLRRVFALTYQEDFFKRLGFLPVDKGDLPHKVWSDCLKCSKFPDCDEAAVMKVLDEEQ